MINKRGQIFGLYLVLLTLFFCGVVVFLFFVAQGNSESSLVSPRDVLVFGDNLAIFEMWEQDLIKESFLDVSANGEIFGTPSFLGKFKNSFIEKVDANLFMKEFVFDGLALNGLDIEGSARSDSKAFFKNVLYPENLIKYSGSDLSVVRGNVGKNFLLEAEDKSKINFPIRVVVELGGGHVLSGGDLACPDLNTSQGRANCKANLNISKI